MFYTITKTSRTAIFIFTNLNLLVMWHKINNTDFKFFFIQTFIF